MHASITISETKHRKHTLFSLRFACSRHLTQVETDPKNLEKIPDFQNFSSPVALVYTKNTRTKYLHRSVTLLAGAFCAWRLYELYK